MYANVHVRAQRDALRGGDLCAGVELPALDMRAVRFTSFGGPEILEIATGTDPHPGAGEVRIAVRAAGIKASDWKKRRGLMDRDLPQGLGYEAAGVVDELGVGVTGVRLGDRAFGFCAGGGAQAELAVLTHHATMPASLCVAVAAALPAAGPRDRSPRVPRAHHELAAASLAPLPEHLGGDWPAGVLTALGQTDHTRRARTLPVIRTQVAARCGPS